MCPANSKLRHDKILEKVDETNSLQRSCEKRKCNMMLNRVTQVIKIQKLFEDLIRFFKEAKK